MTPDTPALPLSDERLAEIRAHTPKFLREMWWDGTAQTVEELLAEVDRLRADVAAIDLAAANVLLAFHDYPKYEGGVYERRSSLNALADAVVAARLPESGGEGR